jgi:hypothetical protein
MQPPTTLKLLCGFVGMDNYYRDMWPHRSDILAPLTAKREKSFPFIWTPEMQKAVDEMKALMEWLLMSFVLILIITNLSTFIQIHLIINLVHAFCKMISLLHSIAKNSIMHR